MIRTHAQLEYNCSADKLAEQLYTELLLITAMAVPLLRPSEIQSLLTKEFDV